MNPSVYQEFGAFRAEAAFVGSGDFAALFEIIRAGKGEKAEVVWLSRTHDLLNENHAQENCMHGSEGGEVTHLAPYSIAWLKGCYALRARYFVYGANCLAIMKFACALLVFRFSHVKLGVGYARHVPDIVLTEK
ncbi:MAG: hypothetical protein HQM03_18240 [Magnetococcales bacterium]|nr:hypothetical protein [Magnetococcales bacterium]